MSTEATPARTREIGGFLVADMRSDELIAYLNQRRSRQIATELYFANSNLIQQCYSFFEELHAPEAIIVNDGIALDAASLFFHRRTFVENLNGTDFTPRYLLHVRGPTRVFLLGAKPATVRRAADRLAAIPNIDVVGAIDGFDGLRDDAEVVEKLAAAKADILLVALGNPLQEKWIVAHRGRHRIPLVIGVGALFDFLSGNVPRAPALIQRLRLEWLYRLAHEPRRLTRRYSIDMLLFFVHCARTHRRKMDDRSRAMPVKQ